MFNKLFSDVGGKLKLLATIWFYLIWIGGMIAGVVLIAVDPDDFVVFGLLMLALSWLVAWLMSLMLYAFGQLVQNSDAIKNKMCGVAVSETTETAPAVSAARAAKEAQLKAWLEQNLITEEEYQAKLQEL